MHSRTRNLGRSFLVALAVLVAAAVTAVGVSAATGTPTSTSRPYVTGSPGIPYIPDRAPPPPTVGYVTPCAEMNWSASYDAS